MQHSSMRQPECELRHERAVIVVPRRGSRLDQEIASGSGIVAVRSGERTTLFFEGNLYGAVNLAEPEDRVICAFGRAATGFPSAAIRGLMPDEVLDIVRVGEITWPNQIHWDSVASAQVFLEYVGRPDGTPKEPANGVSRLEVLEIDMTTLLGLYEAPRALEEWRWTEAMASFEHTGNDVEPGVFEFMVRVRTGDGDDVYESEPPEKVAMVLEFAKKLGATWVLFHQG